MNYLAHLHIAQQCNSDLCGNLLGDFVKGNPYRQYDRPIAEGIMLHRAVDSFTDSHELVREAKSYFSKAQKRFAGIALDMFWDHCLAKHWHNYADRSLEQFTAQSEQIITQTNQQLDELPQNYINLNSIMWSRRWFILYRDFSIMQKALARMSERRPRFTPLATCYPVLAEHYHALTALFEQFYPLVLAHGKSVVTD